MAGKRYYSYQGHSGHRRGMNSSDGLFGWTVFIFLLIGLVFLCWMGSYYIFARPENAANYQLLKRLHKIEPPQRFEITAAPRGEFLKPGQLLERFGPMSASEIRRTNESLLRNFVRNYHQNRELVPYAVGTYRVIGTLPLSDNTFCQPGLVALLQAVEQPEILLEQLFTADEKNIPALQRALGAGQEIKLEKPLDLSAVIHIDRLPDNRIRFTTMPLLYGSYGSGQGPASFSLEPPEELNVGAGLPVLTPEMIGQLSGGKITGSKNAKDVKSTPHLSRIAEEIPATTPEPRVAKALPVTPPSATTTPTALTANEPTVARAIPVNTQPILPAIPVATPAVAVARALPLAPAGQMPTNVAIPTAAAAKAIPVATPVPSIPVAVPAATVIPPRTVPPPVLSPSTAAKAPASPVAMIAPATNAVGALSTNQPTAAAPSEVWPVYTPGQMPRGRLVETSEADALATKGIGGERHYLQGRFTVTAAGNGKAVLRPQGALAGVQMGPSSKMRVIVEFPAGTVPPAEGNIISRDNLRPFQITSVKRGDDGQINIYAREITRGQ